MYEQQQCFDDLQSDSAFGDDNSWLAGDDNFQLSPHQSVTGSKPGNENLDRRLLKDLVEMVPLFEHYMEHKDKSVFKRRGSIIYTKMPSKESLSRRGRNASQTVPGRKKRGHEGNEDVSNNYREDGENANALASEEKEELSRLREQVNDLQTKLSEKEEVLKSMEMSKNQVKEIQEKLGATERLVAEKEMLIKHVQLQLSDTKIKLADKQAAFEKTEWEAKTKGAKAIKLQEQLDAVEGEISTLTRVFKTLAKTDSKKPNDRDYDATPYEFDHLPYLDDIDETDLMKMEEARLAYVGAVTTAKERKDEESLAMAAKARAYLQSLVFTY